MSVRLVSWNIGGRVARWSEAVELDVDVALLQEAPRPPVHLQQHTIPDGSASDWSTAGPEVRRWRTAVLPLTDAFTIEPVATGPLGSQWEQLGTSRV